MVEQMVTIRFEGRSLSCRADTSVAVALWENGIRHLSHSPKYGRPRGVTCARSQCTACLMRVDGVPNVRVCETPVHEGLEVGRQDTGTLYGPSLQKSLALGGKLFPVGFYFKWFTRPAALGRFFMQMIRPMTGIGRLPEARPLPAAPPENEAPDTTDLGDRPHVVVGAGLAGLRAAAACEGPVLLLDENPEPGGLRLTALREIASTTVGLERFRALKGALAELEAAVAVVRDPSVDFQGSSRVVAGYAPAGLLIRQGPALATVRGGEMIWAAGALDTLGLFPGNDTPGVLGPRALLRLLVRDGLDVGGKRVLLVGGGLDFWLAATLLDARGARVALVVTEGGMQSEISAAIDRKWPLNTGLSLAGITGHGAGEVRATFTPTLGTPGPAAAQLRLDADLVVLCGRGKPAYDIPYQLGARLDLAPGQGGFVVAAPPADLPLTAVGEAAGQTPDEVFSMAPEVRT